MRGRRSYRWRGALTSMLRCGISCALLPEKDGLGVVTPLIAWLRPGPVSNTLETHVSVTNRAPARLALEFRPPSALSVCTLQPKPDEAERSHTPLSLPVPSAGLRRKGPGGIPTE